MHRPLWRTVALALSGRCLSQGMTSIIHMALDLATACQLFPWLPSGVCCVSSRCPPGHPDADTRLRPLTPTPIPLGPMNAGDLPICRCSPIVDGDNIKLLQTAGLVSRGMPNARKARSSI